MERCWHYFKCKNCGLDGLVKFGAGNFYVCKECGEKIFYDEKLELDWLNETDENGERVRLDFSGFSEEACREKAAEHFKCKKEDINYYIVQVAGLFKKCIICASKRKEYELSSDMKKIVCWRYENRDAIWLAINTKEKTILYPNELGDKEIKYERIVDLIKDEDTGPCRQYTLVIEPTRRIPILFYPDCLDNIREFIDVLYDELPSNNKGIYTKKYYRIEKFVDMGGATGLECTDITATADGNVYRGRLWAWRENDELCFYNIETLQALCLNLNKIKYYRVTGEKYATTEVSGGGGGGSSIKGAIIGGVIAGDAGAIIGSRKKVDEIKSHTVIHDNQKVLVYSDDLKQIVEFNSNAYNIFLKLIPEKEYDAVMQTTSEMVSSNNNSGNAMELLDKLGNLFEKGIITKEEFDDKKKEILDRI